MSYWLFLQFGIESVKDQFISAKGGYSKAKEGKGDHVRDRQFGKGGKQTNPWDVGTNSGKAASSKGEHGGKGEKGNKGRNDSGKGHGKYVKK